MSSHLRTYLLLVFLFCLSGVLFPQSDKPAEIVPAKYFKSIPVIEPDFSANVTSGPAPLTVQFTDKSTISGVTLYSRKWYFGNGDSIVDLNPATYTFQKEGTYSVTLKLIFKDGTLTYNSGMRKPDYILVGTGCDSLHYPMAGQPVYYGLGQGKGYLSGNNNLGIKALADYFTPSPNRLKISGVRLGWAVVKKVPDKDEKLYVKYMQADVTGSPGKTLDSIALFMSTIDSNFKDNKFTKVVFPTPIEVSEGFFMGITLPVLSGDTLVLYTSGNGAIATNTGWFQQADKTWKSYPSQYANITSLTHYIFPLTCQSIKISTGEPAQAETLFAVWPNPADDILNIRVSGSPVHYADYALIDLAGREISKGKFQNPELEQIDISFLKPGIYFLRIGSSLGTISRKVVKR